MNRLFLIFLLNYVVLALFVIFGYGEEDELTPSPHRTKRFLVFSNISHPFLRLNIKANMVPWNQFFAQAVGFRINWEDPPSSFHPYHYLHRRSLFDRVETMLDRNGMSGVHCIRKAVCELDLTSKPRSVYYKILKIIFRKASSTTDRWHSTSPESCELSVVTCPFSLLEVSMFTDL